MTAEKSNQGMRQPQMGGIQSQLRWSSPTQTCKHESYWRLPGASKWICAVCHPPAVKAFEVR